MQQLRLATKDVLAKVRKKRLQVLRRKNSVYS